MYLIKTERARMEQQSLVSHLSYEHPYNLFATYNDHVSFLKVDNMETWPVFIYNKKKDLLLLYL